MIANTTPLFSRTDINPCNRESYKFQSTDAPLLKNP